MNKAEWSRARAANQPTKSKRARYDHQNDQAAEIILANPESHARCQIDWARRYTARRAEESREKIG